MTTPQELLKKTTCYVNGQTKDGRVLAVASYIDRRMVCFLFEGKMYCDWIPEASLFENKIVISNGDKNNDRSKDKFQKIDHLLDGSRNEKIKDISQNHIGKTAKDRNTRKEAQNDLQNITKFLTENPVKFLNQQVAETNRAINELNREINKIAKGTQETTIQLAQDTHYALVKSVNDATGTIAKVTTDTHANVIQLFDDTCATTIKLTETTTAAIIKFPNDAYLTVYGNTEASTKTLVKIFEDVQSHISHTIARTIELTDIEIRSILNKIFITVNIAVKLILESLSNQWSRYWKERILTAIKYENDEMKLASAKNIVDLLKKDFPRESKREIADRLIHEKAIFATIFTVVNSASLTKLSLEELKIDITDMSIDILNMSNLMVEMIYQISYIYGLDEFLERDIFAIHSICFSVTIVDLLDPALKAIFDLSNRLPIEVKTVVNLMSLLVFGYTAREFCEMKKIEKINPLASENQWKTLEAKVIDYTKEVVLQEKELEASLYKSLTQMSPA